MTLPETLPVLTYDEAEAVAIDLARVWAGITGIGTVPSTETLADLVQRVQRKAREQIAARENAA